MTGKAHENKCGFNTVSQTISHLLYFTLETISVHLQTAAFSRTANATSFTYIVCCIKKIHHTDVSMPGEKMVGESPTLISCVTENPAQRQPSVFWDPGFNQCVSWFAFAGVKVSAKQKLKQKQLRKHMPIFHLFCVCWNGIRPYQPTLCFSAEVWAVVLWAVRSGGVQRLAAFHFCVADVPPSPSHLAPTSKTALSCSVPLLGSNTRSWIKTLLQGPSC